MEKGRIYKKTHGKRHPFVHFLREIKLHITVILIGDDR